MQFITEEQAQAALADMRAHLDYYEGRLVAARPAVAAEVATLHAHLEALDARRNAAIAELANVEREFDETVQTLGKVETGELLHRSNTARVGLATLAELQAGLARWQRLMASDSAGPSPAGAEIAQLRAQLLALTRATDRRKGEA